MWAGALGLQFLESYKSVTLESMANAFGVSSDFMDKELSDFIVAGRLTAKIDKVAGIIETNRFVTIHVLMALVELFRQGRASGSLSPVFPKHG